MMLLTQANRKSLPALYANENTPAAEQVVQVKFFTPDSSWTWYATEFDGEDLSLSDLRTAHGATCLPVERDMYFQPTQWADVAR